MLSLQDKTQYSYKKIYENCTILVYDIVYEYSCHILALYIRVITKLPNSEQSYKGKVKTH